MERKLKDHLVEGAFQGLTAVHSARMRAVKSKGNRSTEVRLRSILVRAGVRGWKLHHPGVAGRPDFYFPEAGVALFVDGCFWHGCPRCGSVPRANHAYWKAKIGRNVERDRENARKLREAGLRPVRIWEHELNEDRRLVIAKIKDALAAPRPEA